MDTQGYNKVKYYWVGIALIVCLLMTSACSIKLVKPVYLDDFEKLDLVDLTEYRNPDNVMEFIRKLKLLKEETKKGKKFRSKQDKEKMVDTIKSIRTEMARYILAINVTNKEKPYLFIPPRTKITLSLSTYCLACSLAVPESDEPYILVQEDPPIPLYREIMNFTHINRSVSQDLKQSLFWNLGNKVKFEDLPPEQKTLLLQVDSNAYLKVNSYLKQLVKKEVRGLIAKLKPSSISKFEEVVTIVEGKVYEYKEYAAIVENLRSKYRKPETRKPIKSKSGEIYTLTSSEGFSKTEVTFINPTDKLQIINSYFCSLRKDVQSLGFDIPYNEEVELAKIELPIEPENFDADGDGRLDCWEYLVDVSPDKAEKGYHLDDDDDFSARTDPITNKPNKHDGIDMQANNGDTVRADGDGYVDRIDTIGEDARGKRIVIIHDDGYKSEYWHLTSLTVQEGDRIKAGQPIGTVGKTGRATGPHLHYGVKNPKGEWIDPCGGYFH